MSISIMFILKLRMHIMETTIFEFDKNTEIDEFENFLVDIRSAYDDDLLTIKMIARKWRIFSCKNRKNFDFRSKNSRSRH